MINEETDKLKLELSVSRIAQLEAELTATNALVAAVAAAVDEAWNEAVAECETAIGTAFDKTGNIMDILKAVAALKRPTQSKPEPVIMPAWDDLPKEQKKDQGIHWVSPIGGLTYEGVYTFVRNALQSLQKSKKETI